MEILIVSSSPSPMIDPPTDFLTSVLQGKGGFIKIEPGCPPPKVLWTLKALLQGIGIGFQWTTFKSLVDEGMSGEYAEAHVTTLVNNLVVTEVPPLPSEQDMEDIREGFIRANRIDVDLDEEDEEAETEALDALDDPDFEDPSDDVS